MRFKLETGLGYVVSDTMFGALSNAEVLVTARGELFGLPAGHIRISAFDECGKDVYAVLNRDQLRHFGKECIAVADYTGDPYQITDHLKTLEFVHE